MNDLTSILATRAWACRPEALRALARQARHGAPAAEAFRAAGGRNLRAAAVGVQVIPIAGLITQRGGWFGTSTEDVSRALDAALADRSVGALVLDLDSPGGEVYGVEECGARLRAARTVKPIVASVNSQAASAAYWLAAQATEILITPSGEAGSVGVYTVHEDWSGALDQAGIVVSLVETPPGKTAGNPFEALGADARTNMQKQVDFYYSMFASAITKGRGVSAARIRNVWGARMYQSKEAVALAVVDDVGTLDQAITRAAALARTRGTAAPGAATTSPELDIETRIRSRR